MAGKTYLLIGGLILMGVSCAIEMPSVRSFENPAGPSCCVRLHETPDGNILMSWIEYLDDTTDALMMTSLADGKWTQPVKITQGSNWFTNWADFPTIASYEDGKAITAHWLEMSGEGTFDYDIHLIQSEDLGKSWGNDFVIHSDGVQAEHGFVSLTPVPGQRMFASWLDGRRTKVASHDGRTDHDHDHGHGAGEMMLRGAIFDQNNQVHHEWQLDGRVCDCCGTASTLTSSGLVVAYRDRSESEIRDIAIVRQEGFDWSEPFVPHPDNWKIAGCPVNGPALDAEENRVALAWFGMHQDQARVKVSFSNDGAKTFEPAIDLDQGDPLGRVNVQMLDEERAIVIWLENHDDHALVMAAICHHSGEVEELLSLGTTSAARSSGFPALSKHPEGALIGWTHTSENAETLIQTVILELP